MQSISEFLESHGYVAKEGVYVRDTQIIDPQEWLGLSLESFSRKAIEKGWTQPTSLGDKKENNLESSSLIHSLCRKPIPRPLIQVPASYDLIPAKLSGFTAKPLIFLDENKLTQYDYYIHEDYYYQELERRIKWTKASLVRQELAVQAKEKHKRRIEMTDDEKVGYVSKYGMEAFFDLPLK